MVNLFFIIVFLILNFISSKFFFKAYFSPYAIYNSIWISSIGLYYLNLFNYINITTITTLLIFGSLLTFILGSLTIGLFYYEKKFINYKVYLNFKLLKFFIFIFSILGFLGIIIFVVKSINTNGFLNYLFYAKNIRKSFFDSGQALKSKFTNYSVGFTYIASSLSGIFLAKNKNHNFIFAFLPILSIILYGFFYLGRIDILIVFILYGSSYYLSTLNKDIDKKQIIKILIIILLLFISLVSISLITDKFSMIKQYNDSVPPVLLHIYDYLVTPIPALDVALKDINNYSYGERMFYPVARILYNLKIINHPPVTNYINNRVWTPAPSNTFTYLRRVFEDFGLLGVYIFSYILGLVSNMLFLECRYNLKLYKVVLLSFIYCFITLSFAGFQFSTIQYFFATVLSTLIGFILDINQHKNI